MRDLASGRGLSAPPEMTKLTKQSFGLKLPSLERGCKVQGMVVSSAKSPLQNTLNHPNFSNKTQDPKPQSPKTPKPKPQTLNPKPQNPKPLLGFSAHSSAKGVRHPFCRSFGLGCLQSLGFFNTCSWAISQGARKLVLVCCCFSAQKARSLSRPPILLSCPTSVQGSRLLQEGVL